MLVVALSCLGLIVFTTLLFFEVLSLLSNLLERLRRPGRLKLLLAVLGCFGGHGAGILIYGLAYLLLAHAGGHGGLGAGLPSPGAALYFSAETYTSLGFGDVVPFGPLRLVAGVEALNGLLLIAWSASFLYLEMERHWRAPRGGL
jgi:hypothetical protein